MILQALVQYYEALLARGEIDRPGWSKVNVSWRLDLNPDGSLFDVSPLQKPSPNGKKMLPQKLAVPAQVKRSSSVAANFLCDTSSYLLGVDDKGKPERTKAPLTQACRFRQPLFFGKMEPPTLDPLSGRSVLFVLRANLARSGLTHSAPPFPPGG